MTIETACPPRPACRGRVIALHCSGGGAGQWRSLAEMLGRHYDVLAPEHYGCETSGAWTGEHAFTLADEAARTIALIDKSEKQVHLVGHSYGGSMALYEPSAFHLLRQMGEPGVDAYAEIAGVARRISHGVANGDYRTAVAAFVDYWNVPGAWAALRPSAQTALIRWAPKGPLDFRALMNEPTPVNAYRDLSFPVLILRGERAPRPTRMIAEGLAELLPASRRIVIGGAGHMGPLSHAPEVSALIARHIAEADAQPRRRPHVAENVRAATRRAAAASCRSSRQDHDSSRANQAEGDRR
jgi:pimeloyl-ACP methyl ester carboxylesterase